MSRHKWIDISQPLNKETAAWPGDTPFSYQLTFSKAETGAANVGEITASCHIGTHIDAPFHFEDNGQRVIELDLETCIGPARVIDVSAVDYIDAAFLASHELDGVERLLLHTSLPNDPTRFPNAYPSLSPDIGPFLKRKGVKLLGVDLPSVDLVTNEELTTHHALHENGIYILENIMLDHVTPGDYELIALPLALEEADGSPVRAVLRAL